jgi:excisionase family DNA binding protein
MSVKWLRMMEYCTIQDGAKLLGVSRPTVYKRIEEGKLKVYAVLGRPALKLSEVSRLKIKRQQKSNGNGNRK